ncbi:hypothetical protein AB0O34_26890 [Sphaerisporangium sp. NPDC088356]|uniref:hypothetical protein n=1 Tax=Sphaerisporangium sp. NPDC088356 TaxID=3154871 RepID=UPI00343BA079
MDRHGVSQGAESGGPKSVTNRDPHTPRMLAPMSSIGGMGAVSAAIRASAESFGAHVLTEAAVERVIVRNQCSSATHGGGGVTGIAGYLCSKRILRDRRWRR